MIGGQDVIIPTGAPLAALDLAVRAVRRLWPHSVLEDGETGDVLGSYSAIILAGRREILAFKDSKAAQMWAEIGADASTNGTLIHLLISADALTVVVDDEPSAEMKMYIGAIRRALTQDLFAKMTERKAAA